MMKRTPLIHQKPSQRVRHALNRLSRERWISGKDCVRIGTSWAWLLSDRPEQVMRGAIGDVIPMTGLLRGMAAVSTYEKDWRHVIRRVNQLAKSPKRGFKPELELLRFHLFNLKESNHGS